jgi:hypothetical protein
MMIEELKALRLTHNQELLFPHRLNNKEPMRSESILAVIKRSGYAGRMTTHGFRSLFSNVVNDSNLFNQMPLNASLPTCHRTESAQPITVRNIGMSG